VADRLQRTAPPLCYIADHHPLGRSCENCCWERLLCWRCPVRPCRPLGLPAYKAPPAPLWSWTGCYIGGHTGWLQDSQEWTNRTPGGAFDNQWLGGHRTVNALLGVQAGCDYQFAGGWLVGLDGDYAWTDGGEGGHDSRLEFGVADLSKVVSLSTAGGRLGYAWDRWLGYVKGGGAWQHDNYWATTIITGPAYTTTVTRSGWTVGAGGEYALTRFLSVFAEYSYCDFGTSRIGLTPILVGLRPAFVDLNETASVLRVGLNLRFGG
jgi:outer membrane immunogenic protein